MIIRGESSILIDICVSSVEISSKTLFWLLKSIKYSTFIIIDHKHGLNMKTERGLRPQGGGGTLIFPAYLGSD